MSVETDLDALYAGAPEDFTARRKELVAAARKRGDAFAAKTLAGARRPTTAAWAVNALVHTDPTARDRLGEFTAELKAAHAAMDGDRIRELSRAQRALVAELVRAAFAAARVDAPSAGLRDDVVGTLQAAIADADVAARLGRLEKAEQWSGFGDFGVSAAVGGEPKRAPAAKPATASDDDGERRGELERQRSAAAARLATAEKAHDAAAGAVTERTAALAAARRRYEKLLATLSAAEHVVDSADDALEAAQERLGDAAAARDAASAALNRVDSELADLEGG